MASSDLVCSVLQCAGQLHAVARRVRLGGDADGTGPRRAARVLGQTDRPDAAEAALEGVPRGRHGQVRSGLGRWRGLESFVGR